VSPATDITLTGRPPGSELRRRWLPRHRGEPARPELLMALSIAIAFVTTHDLWFVARNIA
jgi:hypothetical protein